MFYSVTPDIAVTQDDSGVGWKMYQTTVITAVSSQNTTMGGWRFRSDWYPGSLISISKLNKRSLRPGHWRMYCSRIMGKSAHCWNSDHFFRSFDAWVNVVECLGLQNFDVIDTLNLKSTNGGFKYSMLIILRKHSVKAHWSKIFCKIISREVKPRVIELCSTYRSMIVTTSNFYAIEGRRSWRMRCTVSTEALPYSWVEYCLWCIRTLSERLDPSNSKWSARMKTFDREIWDGHWRDSQGGVVDVFW